MRFLVTGSSGYIGATLIERLLEAGHDRVTAVVRSDANTARLERSGLRIAKADLCKMHEVEGLQGILRETDCIFHLAAGTSGSHYQMFMNTVVATANLLDALEKEPVRRLVLVSSFSVYQMSALPSGAVLDENCPLEPNLKLRDSYTICKVRQERLVRQRCAELGIPLVVIRPGKIYGPKDNPLFPQLGLRIPGICFLLIGGKHLLPLTQVSNCVESIYLAGVRDNVEGQAFNIVDDNLPTQREYLDLYKEILPRIQRMVPVPYSVFKILARFFEVATVATKGNIPPVVSRYRAENLWKNLRYDNSRAKSVLGWMPRIRTADGIREMLMSLVDA